MYWVPTLRGIGDPFGQERRLRFGTSIPRRWGVQVAESLRHWWLWHWQRKNGRGEAEGSGTDSYCAEHCSPSHPPPGEGREIAHDKEEDCRGLAASISQLPVSSGLHHDSSVCVPQPQAAEFVPPVPLSRGEVPKKKKKKKKLVEQRDLYPGLVDEFGTPWSQQPQRVKELQGQGWLVDESTRMLYDGSADEACPDAEGSEELDAAVMAEADACYDEDLEIRQGLLEEAPYETIARMHEVLDYAGYQFASLDW